MSEKVSTDLLNQKLDFIIEQLKVQDERFVEFKADTNRKLSRLEDRVDAIHDTRDRVTVRFTHAWAGASLFIGFFAAFLAVVTTKIIA